MSIKLIGPFRQLVTLRQLPKKGPLKDEQLEIISEGGLVVQDEKILAVGKFDQLKSEYANQEVSYELLEGDFIGLPGLVDAHTHICFGGSRAMDFAARNAGKTYLEIAGEGGGIWSTVKHTRAATQQQLTAKMSTRMDRLLANGVTTVEAKSGYGLAPDQELKMLRAIKNAGANHKMDVVATCLAAHIIPKDIQGGEQEYLLQILEEIVPVVQKENLCRRFDIFTEQSAFSVDGSREYLKKLKALGFDLTVHGDQFTPGGSGVAIDCGALSVDHLEASGDAEIKALAASEVIPVALPGASLGLGCPFTPARKLLDLGCSLAIASDWNPGSAPQGDLLTQASILATFEKLSTTEVFAGITFRAAAALGLSDRGRLAVGMLADCVAFPGTDYREILYLQGSLKPVRVWKGGEVVVGNH